MKNLIHTIECVRETTRQEGLITSWKQRWPKYCRSCGGLGGHHDPGVYRYPDGSGEPPSFDECECIDEGRCPRCGMDWNILLSSIDDPFYTLTSTAEGYHLVEFLADNEWPCPCCGWSWGLNSEDVCPLNVSELGPCECELEYDARLEKEYHEMMQREYNEKERDLGL